MVVANAERNWFVWLLAVGSVVVVVVVGKHVMCHGWLGRGLSKE